MIPTLLLSGAAFSQTVDQDMIRRIHEIEGKGLSEPFAELGRRGRIALPTLAKLLSSHRREIAWEAMQTLVRIKDPKVLPLLWTEAKAANGNRRSNIFLAIGNHGNPEAATLLLPFLKSKDHWECGGAAYGLGRLGNPIALGPLTALAKHPNRSVQWQAKEAARQIRSMVRKYPGRLSDPRAWWRKR